MPTILELRARGVLPYPSGLTLLQQLSVNLQLQHPTSPPKRIRSRKPNPALQCVPRFPNATCCSSRSSR